MRNVLSALVVSIAVPGMAFAECPPVPDHGELQSMLIADLQKTTDEYAAAPIMGALWSIWKNAPDDNSQALLDEGVSRIRVSDYSAAITVLSELVDYCPDYAEGYNQRAFAYFLQGEFADALLDLDVAIELSPQHIGALSGRALTLMNLGQIELAHEQLRRALELNPWLNERHLLAKPNGQEL